MGLWLVQVLEEEDLKKLDEKQIDLLKSKIRHELASNREIIEALKKEIKPFHEKLTR